MAVKIHQAPIEVLLVTLLMVVLSLAVAAKALDQNLVYSMRNRNCSRYLNHQSLNMSHSPMCPPWYVEEKDSRSKNCTIGLNVHEVVYFMDRTSQPWLQQFLCMTSSPNESSPPPPRERDILGNCLFSFDSSNFSPYYPLPCNVSELND